MTRSGIYSRVSRITVLFVDDDADTRFAYESIATAEGFGVELAADGHEAVALANVVLPDVIVLDVTLPGIDGFEVVRRLRASPRTRAIPIIVVTGSHTEQMDAAIRATGVEGHLIKPCGMEPLLNLVNVLTIGSQGSVPGIKVDTRAG